MVTAELAVAMPVAVLVAALMLSGLSLALDQIRCVDGARAAARELARGETSERAAEAARAQAPAGAAVSVMTGAGTVRVQVSSQPPRILRLIGVVRGGVGVAVAVPERGAPP